MLRVQRHVVWLMATDRTEEDSGCLVCRVVSSGE